MEVKLAGDIHDVVIGRPNNSRTLWTLGTDMGHLEESFILSLQIAESAMLTSNIGILSRDQEYNPGYRIC